MKLVKGGELQRPNLCTICERTPAIGEVVIDTEKYFDGFPHNLQGKRYVCKRCSQEFARLIRGDVVEAEYQRVVMERDNALEKLKRIKDRIEATRELTRVDL